MKTTTATLTATLVATFAVLTAARADAADTLRCGGMLIERGASMAEVEALCGEPDAKESSSTGATSAKAGFRFV